MIIKKLMFGSPDFPEALRNIPGPPQQLYHAGAPLRELLNRPAVAIVGSRTPTPYGQDVTARLAGELAGQGVVIVSGLAFGIDAIAHRAALDAGGLAIAVLPSPLEHIVPVYNRNLARQILDGGGALVSEYGDGALTFKQNFVARNRLMSGLARGLLITEAAENSGSLHTARFAIEQGRHVMAVPGNIRQPRSIGTNNLIKTSQAAAVTNLADILHGLGLRPHKTPIKKVKGRNRREQAVLDLMLKGVSDGHLLLKDSGLTASHYAQTITMLEIGGKIRPLGANHWAIV